jgi:glycosyltransferase involved in cell wall biosynthesis
MRILWLKSDLLLPLDKGGKLRTWHLMRHLARRHTITYLSFAEPGQPQADVDGMREIAERVVTIPRCHPPKRSLRFYAGAARYIVDPLPYAVGRHRSARYRREVARLLASDPFDVVVCDFLPPAVNLPTQLPCPAVLFTHNVEAEIWRRHADTQTTAVGRWLFDAQCRRMLRFEGRTLARFDGVLAVSEFDSLTFSRLYPRAAKRPIRVVPTGVDTQYVGAAPPSHRASRRLVFTGSMDWLPNEDAVLFFCRNVLPQIRAQEPETTFSIVGRAPTPAVRALGTLPGVTVTGRVPDVRPYLRDAAVVVVPLRIGGGTRLKIFEAMARGRAVVCTAVGAVGL